MHTPKPTMLRIYEGKNKGATSFYRNRTLLHTIIELLNQCNQPTLNILFHACSCGAEVYSFIANGLREGLFDRSNKINIFATDIEPNFIKLAKKGHYPNRIRNGLNDNEIKDFITLKDMLVIRKHIINRVDFLEASSFINFKTDTTFDAVFITNALTYVSQEQQSEAIKNISQYNSNYLITTAFHPDTIKHDILDNNYAPVSQKREAIHNDWGGRLTTNTIDESSPEHS